MLRGLSLFSVDVDGASCWGLNMYQSVYLVSITPLAMGSILVLILGLRWAAARGDEGARKRIQDQHSWLLLLLSFLVLPPVTLVQLRALDCINVEPLPDVAYSVVRSNTSIDCTSAKYKAFVAADSMLIALYLLAPVVWLVLLFRCKEHLDPPGAADDRQAVRIRDVDPSLTSLRFLFNTYRPSMFYWEAVEM